MVDQSLGNSPKKDTDLKREIEELKGKNRELEETLDAIRGGEVDAIIVSKGDNQRIYTLEGADTPYRVLVENIHEGALTLSRTGMILYANVRFSEMVKQPLNKIAGTSIIDYICPPYQAETEKALREIKKRACRNRLRIRQGEKGSIPVMISMNPLDHGDDTKISVVVTDHRKDEDRILLQARMLDAVGDAVIAADTDNKIFYWNNAATKMFGWQPEETTGRDLIDVVTPDILNRDARVIAGRLRKGEIVSGEYVVRHRDGHEFPIYASDAPVFDDDGKLVAVISSSHDISERKRAENELRKKHEDLNAAYEEIASTQEELRRNVRELTIRERELSEAFAEKEVLLSEIHHRVKNNLAAFISLLSLDGSYEETQVGHGLKKDLQNRARTMALIHETLYRTHQYSEVDMDVYLDTLVGQVVSSYGIDPPIDIVVEAKGIKLDLARATPTGLIINELVTNAIKYAFPPHVIEAGKDSGAAPKIEVRMRNENGTYLLKVSDNGIGLPKKFDFNATQTLGLKLVNFLSRHQLRSKPEVHGEDGTEFVFRFRD